MQCAESARNTTIGIRVLCSILMTERNRREGSTYDNVLSESEARREAMQCWSWLGRRLWWCVSVRHYAYQISYKLARLGGADCTWSRRETRDPNRHGRHWSGYIGPSHSDIGGAAGGREGKRCEMGQTGLWYVTWYWLIWLIDWYIFIYVYVIESIFSKTIFMSS